MAGPAGSARGGDRACTRAATALRRPAGRAEAVWPPAAAGSLRFLARDYLLDPTDEPVLARFDVPGDERLRAALARGRGTVLVGGHLGAHVAAFHWLFRSGVPLRLMVQRPHHVAASLNRFFDRDEPEPQAGFFLRRALAPGECVARVLRARGAARGQAVYLPGDIPWTGPNTRSGRLLGRPTGSCRSGPTSPP